jgi:hypothetical protein
MVGIRVRSSMRRRFFRGEGGRVAPRLTAEEARRNEGAEGEQS